MVGNESFFSLISKHLRNSLSAQLFLGSYSTISKLWLVWEGLSVHPQGPPLPPHAARSFRQHVCSGKDSAQASTHPDSGSDSTEPSVQHMTLGRATFIWTLFFSIRKMDIITFRVFCNTLSHSCSSVHK